jgi:hypothetical protein
MLKKVCLLIIVGIAAVVLAPEWSKPPSAQDDMAVYRNNSCVSCHSNDSLARASFHRYTEWFISLHKDKGVSCDKCHGGDPAAKEVRRAHAGVIKPAEALSRLHPRNLPGTCNSCHPGIVSSFVESLHYQKLTTSGMGPSCTTCHTHMATTVLHTPEETATLCAHCHDTINGIMPRRPEIPQKANEVMQSIRRANMMVLWADRLLEQGQAKKADISAEERDMKIVRALLVETKITWHSFNLDLTRKKADEAFEMGTKVKDSLRRKLYPGQGS